MSGSTTERADSPADFGADKRGVAARWIAELRLAQLDAKDFLRRAREVERRYLDERKPEDAYQTRFAVFWSNVQTLKPAIYATPPKAVVQRRYLDADPIARAASTILQRAIQTNIDQTGWHEVTEQAVDDYLIVGRGTAWARYEPHFEDVSAPQIQAQEASEDGMQAPPDMASPKDGDSDNETSEPDDDGLQVTSNAENDQEITYEEVCWDYVHWKDFRHAPARTWPEVRWVAREVLMTLDEGVERFGSVFKSVPLSWRPDGLTEDDPAFQLFSRARVFEIWDKPSRKVLWVCPDYGDAPLDERDDPLKLTDFFPCPRPLYATQTSSSLMPRPDLVFYQDQANELNSLTARISNIAKATKVAGVYNAGADGIQRVMNEGVENELIPVEQWGQFSQQGGFKGAVDFLPLESMVIALRELVQVREQTKADLYEITGIADIIRGQGAATATATAERLKGQFAQLRLRARVQDVARFCRDMVRITGEIIAKHFQPETLLLLSDYQQTVGADPQQAQAAIALLKNDQLRGFRVEIEVDSTVVADQEQEQQSRVEFLQMAGQFLQQAVPLAAQFPQLGVLAGQMLLFAIRGFPVGREMETVFETALQSLQQAAQQPQPPPPPDPALVKAQTDAQLAQAEMQQRGQLEQQKLALEAQRAEQAHTIETAKLLLEHSRVELENRKTALEQQRFEMENNNQVADMAMRAQDLDLKRRQEAADRDYGQIEAVQGAVAQIQMALDKVMQTAQAAHEAATAPRSVAILRGPDGRAIGARQVIEGAE